MFKVICLSFILLFASCTTTVPPGKLSSSTMSEVKSFQELETRAAFDLKCETLEFVALREVLHDGQYIHNRPQVGVEGCGDRAVYLFTPAGWVLNSELKNTD